METRPSDDLPSAAWVIDPVFGRQVGVPDRAFRKIACDHQDLTGLTRRVVLEAVANANAHRPGHAPNRHVFYRRGVGPSRWLCVVVQYDRSESGEAFTAFAVRRLPKETGR